MAFGFPPASVVHQGSPQRPPQITAAKIMLVAALFLVFLGGCFCVGILSLLAPQLMNPAPNLPPVSWSPATYMFLSFLYTLAIVCFTAAGIFIFLAARTLLGIMQSKTRFIPEG